MELNELEVLQRETSTGNHGVTVARACMRASAAEVGTSVTTSGQDGLVSTEAVQSTVLHVQCDDTDTLAVLHDEVEGEVFDKEVGVVSERLAIEGVQKSVSGTVSGGSATVSLATLSKFQRLTTESALVDLALLRPGERNTIVLKLQAVRTRLAFFNTAYIPR